MFMDNMTYFHNQSTPNNEKMLDKTLQREINLARNIQTSLLNGKTPRIEGGEVLGNSLPARLIGGDYYDFYPLINGKIRIVIGDVMGKGIPAAMLMILTRGAFRSAAESTQGPGETLTAINQAIYQDLRVLRSFVTLFCADWDPTTGIFTYANAGHHLPVYINGKSQKKIELPMVKGVMVGGLPNQKYKEECVRLGEQDIIFFYTDGITEAQNKDGEQFQLERLIQSLLNSSNECIKEIEKCVIDSVNEFTSGIPQKDDITMVLLKINEDKTDISSFNSPKI